MHPVDRHVGERLRRLRLIRGVSQTDVAEKLGITFQQVQKYEQGKNRISASKLYEVAMALSMPPAYFFEGLWPEEDGTVQEAPELDRHTIALVKQFGSIKDESIRTTLIELLKSLNKRD